MRPQTRPDVMVVDDEQRLREVLVRGIRQMGFVCEGAATGEDALRQLREQPRGVVIVDLNLPGMDGMELFEKIRRGWPATQVIVLTGFGDLDTAQHAIRLDVVDFLTKPTHLGELEASLSRAWRRIDDAVGLDAVVLPENEGDDEDGVPPGKSPAPPDSGAASDGDRSLEEIERDHILRTLSRHDGNRRATAEALGISLRTLYYRLNQYQGEGLL
ncbi:MAG: response regulator [Planctomycetota bacterium]